MTYFSLDLNVLKCYLDIKLIASSELGPGVGVGVQDTPGVFKIYISENKM